MDAAHGGANLRCTVLHDDHCAAGAPKVGANDGTHQTAYCTGMAIHCMSAATSGCRVTKLRWGFAEGCMRRIGPDCPSDVALGSPERMGAL